MKCPKCGYVGFESADKCRNCGYHFALAEAEPDADLRIEPEVEALPAPDFDFRTGQTPLPRQRPATPNSDFDLPPRTPRRIVPAPADDLPLFGVDQPAAAGAPRAIPMEMPAASPRRKSEPARLPGSMPRPEGPTPTPKSPRLRPRLDTPALAALTLEPEGPRDELLRGAGPRATAASRPAGSIARAVAGLLDLLILGGLDLAVLYFTLRVCRLSFADIGALPIAPLVGFFVLLDGAYLVLFTAKGGQTIGKMATSIRVVAEDGQGVEVGQATVRAFGYVASAIPAGLGFVQGLFGRKALHDRLANTRVIKL